MCAGPAHDFFFWLGMDRMLSQNETKTKTKTKTNTRTNTNQTDTSSNQKSALAWLAAVGLDDFQGSQQQAGVSSRQCRGEHEARGAQPSRWADLVGEEYHGGCWGCGAGRRQRREKPFCGWI